MSSVTIDLSRQDVDDVEPEKMQLKALKTESIKFLPIEEKSKNHIAIIDLTLSDTCDEKKRRLDERNSSVGCLKPFKYPRTARLRSVSQGNQVQPTTAATASSSKTSHQKIGNDFASSLFKSLLARIQAASVVMPAKSSVLSSPSMIAPLPKTGDDTVASDDCNKHFNCPFLQHVQPESEEYFIVAKMIGKAFVPKIIRIDRVDDPRRLLKFESHREFLKRANVNPNEHQLFHGARAESVASILRQGFNRSFAGCVNGASYGRGVYFARDCARSLSYAHPDVAGVSRVLLCDVLVGQAAVGQHAMLVPPSRPGAADAYDLCDSTVDQLEKPTIFVCYHDDQVYWSEGSSKRAVHAYDMSEYMPMLSVVLPR